MKTPELGPWLQRFFHVSTCSFSATSVQPPIAAYRDTFRLLLRYLKKRRSRSCFSLPLDVLTPDTVVRFLDHLERQRGNCIRTRNARLAAIRSFVHYLSDWLGPDLPTTVARIPGIPFKRHAQRLISFLNPQEVEAILAVTDETWTGQRDHLLFLLLFNTGARISEILALRVMDVNVNGRQIELLGKGRKHRRVPLWSQTQRRLRRWLKDNRQAPEAPFVAQSASANDHSRGCSLSASATRQSRLGSTSNPEEASHLSPFLQTRHRHGPVGSQCPDRSNCSLSWPRKVLKPPILCRGQLGDEEAGVGEVPSTSDCNCRFRPNRRRSSLSRQLVVMESSCSTAPCNRGLPLNTFA